MSRKRALAFGVGAVGLVAAAPFVGCALAARAIVIPWRAPFRGGATPADLGLAFEDLRATAPDGTTTVAWRVAPEAPRGAVLLLHGISDRRSSQLPLARALFDEGFAAVPADLRAHGESGGRYCTFGVRESEGIRALLDALEARGDRGPFAVHGVSLGAAVAIQAAAADARIRAVVAQSSFANLPDLAPTWARRLLLGLPVEPLVPAILRRAGALADFDPAAASPIEAIRRVRVPVLLVHGALDQKIPVEHSRRLLAAGAGHARLVEVERAGHDDLWEVAGDAHLARVVAFLLESLAADPGASPPGRDR